MKPVLGRQPLFPRDSPGHPLAHGAVAPVRPGVGADAAEHHRQRVEHRRREVSKSISDSYWSRQASRAEVDHRGSNQILGVEDVRDRATGREPKVEAGANHYWIDPRGKVVGTNTDSRPNLDDGALIRLP